jgi:hypothetical protein
MNLIMIHLGESIPDHAFSCWTQTTKYIKENFHIICNNSMKVKHSDYFKSNNIIVHSVEDLSSDMINRFSECSYLRSGFWSYCTIRLFYIEELIKRLDLTDVLHYENDVLIYNNLFEFEDAFSKYDYNAITPVGEYWMATGMMYIKNDNAINLINNFIINEISTKSEKQIMKESNVDMVNDMTLLKIFQNQNKDIVRNLPILP